MNYDVSKKKKNHEGEAGNYEAKTNEYGVER